jgi:4-amino-4-deoxy-L-arabinose transferase-like glycosyltransferase
VILVLLLALGLRLWQVDGQSLWSDEGNSVALAQRDLATIARDASNDIHPPLYYWLLSGWLRLAGTSETGVRSLSVLLGVLLVALTFILGRALAGRWAALLAALLAAIHPFQIYYSQEARMYILAAALAVGALLVLTHFVRSKSWTALVALVLLEAAGLYTHYSFVFIVLVLNLAFVAQLPLRRSPGAALRELGVWALSQAAVVLLYLPWLPIALRQLTRWPSPESATGAGAAWGEACRWLAFGPTIETGRVVLPLIVVGMAAALGALSLAAGWFESRDLPRGWAAVLLVLAAGLPLVLIMALGLYREAYLKFLLVSAAPLILPVACGLTTSLPGGNRGLAYARRVLQLAAAGAIVITSALALGHYYTDASYARDDYRAIAAHVEAVGQSGDVVLLNAPGQQEVFDYYYDGPLPVHPLPESRPLDPATTEATLQQLVEPGGRVFAVLWATAESDPERFIENWLDSHTYRAADSWYGNVRLAVFAVPAQIPSAPSHQLNAPLRSPQETPDGGDEIELVGYHLLDEDLHAGGIAQITLYWRAEETPRRRYKVFLHLLDRDNHIVGQRDSEPGGGARLTTLWAPGELVADNYGVLVHPATPPGQYRLEVGMYDLDSGQRLVTHEGEPQIWLEPLTVVRPLAPWPASALGMQHQADVEFGALTLLGYDANRLGFTHQTEAPLHPGDLLHVSLYWRAEEEPSDNWQVRISLLDPDDGNVGTVTAEPVAGYPTSLWQAGDIWRGQFHLPVPGDAGPGPYRLQIQLRAPDGEWLEPVFSEPLRVEH